MRIPLFSPALSRRSFIAASTAGLAGLTFGHGAFGAAAAPVRRKPAKSTILFFLCGGASHIDMWDMKPEAPLEYRGEFQTIKTSSPEIQLCEHLPLLAKQAHRFAMVHGVTDYGRATGDHHAGYYYNLTGHQPDATFRQQGNDRRPYPDDWPHMGCVVARARPAHEKLPNLITLPHIPSKAPYTRPGQFAGRLGLEYDPFLLSGSFNEPLKFSAPTLTMDAGMSRGRLDDRRGLLAALNAARRELDGEVAVRNYTAQQERAFKMLSSSATAGAFDIASESAATKERYGSTINGTSLL